MNRKEMLTKPVRICHILIAEDNEDDLLLFRRAIAKSEQPFEIHHVEDGEKAIAYLSGEDSSTDRSIHPYPDMIILDIKMPRKTGLEVLEWLKEHPDHQTVPTIIMSASNIEHDIVNSYKLGANTFFMKPGSFSELVDLTTLLTAYWNRAKKPDKV